jgi:hypothetical protein
VGILPPACRGPSQSGRFGRSYDLDWSGDVYLPFRPNGRVAIDLHEDATLQRYYERLAEPEATYDPSNLFGTNVNIEPRSRPAT